MIARSALNMNDHRTNPPPSSLDVAQTPVFDVRDLLGGGREVVIIHAGERYRLRVTANDKLILTK
jgi:hemin uptake protein HemP